MSRSPSGCCRTSPTGRSRWCAARRGAQKKCFYQRHAGSGVPEQLRRGAIPGFEEPYLYIATSPGCRAGADGRARDPSLGRAVDQPDRADRIVFDLDPGEGLGFGDVVAAAKEVRARLKRLGLDELRQDDRRQGPARRRAGRAPTTTGRR